MEETKLNVVKEDYGVAKAFRLKAIPYVGIYGSPYYLMPPLTILKPTNIDIVKHMPPKLRKVVSMFAQKYPKGDIDFFVINHNAINAAPSKAMTSVRLNYVVHPYVFYNCHEIREDRAFIKMSLYKLSESDQIYSANEKGGIPIDADNLLDEGCKREVHIHPSDKKGCACFSPNNAAFYLVFSQPLIAFFGCCIVPYENYGKLTISLHTLFSNYKAQIYNHLDSIVLGSNLKELAFSEKNKDLSCVYSNSILPLVEILIEHVRNIFAFATRKFIHRSNELEKDRHLEETLVAIGTKILCVGEKMSTEERELAKAFTTLFYKGKWIKCVDSNYKGTFIKSYIKELPFVYYVKLLKNFMHEVIDDYKDIFALQRALLGSEKGSKEEVKEVYVDEEIFSEQKKAFPDCSFFTEDCTGVNPDMDLLNFYISMVASDNEEEKTVKVFWKLSNSVRNLIFYKAWLIKGQPKNIHDKFGEYSFFGVKEIEKKYYLNKEEKLILLREILFDLLRPDV